MLAGLEDLSAHAHSVGIAKGQFRSRRILVNASATEIDSLRALDSVERRPRLVITSPPYPGVHVLYHRWQYRGRKETPAPYRIANLQDGHPEKYYTAGGRSRSGVDQYFSTMQSVFGKLHAIVSPGATIVQLVGFADPENQVPRYARILECAGFEPWRSSSGRAVRLSRKVHNRKWYHRVRRERTGGAEFLLIHRRA
jgi:hypothetical protein